MLNEQWLLHVSCSFFLRINTRQPHCENMDTIRQRRKYDVVVRECQIGQEHFDVPKTLQPKSGFRAPMTSPTEAQKSLHTVPNETQSERKKMDSRGIEPRTTPRIEFKALCASEMLREYYTTKPRARESSCYSFDGNSFSNSNIIPKKKLASHCRPNACRDTIRKRSNNCCALWCGAYGAL
jgi:hypothetical protein